jgi:putative ABC transport system permease protein
VLLINQKIKEIGVRKVNGAKISEVLISINKTFFGWLIGSLIIAIPVSYIIVNNWLSNFQYKVKISWWIFILAGLIAFLIALGTISLQSWKAARRNR